MNDRAMTARDIYGVILRVFGLYLFLWGIWNVLAGIKYLPLSFAALLTHNSTERGSFGYFFYGVPAVIAGLLMLRFAEGCVNFTYRQPKAPPLPSAELTAQPSPPE